MHRGATLCAVAAKRRDKVASSRDEADTDNAQLERCGKEVEVGQQGGSRGVGQQKDRRTEPAHNRIMVRCSCHGQKRHGRKPEASGRTSRSDSLTTEPDTNRLRWAAVRQDGPLRRRSASQESKACSRPRRTHRRLCPRPDSVRIRAECSLMRIEQILTPHPLHPAPFVVQTVPRS